MSKLFYFQDSMNIFYLDDNPGLCAAYHGDKHVVKMILESAQLLSTAHHVLDPLGKNIKHMYKPTHRNHPCAIWARETLGNYSYLYSLFTSLCMEYTYRYQKTHASEALLKYLVFAPATIRVDTLVQPPQAMPEQYKHPDAVVAYRNYYFHDKFKNGIVQYNKTREMPNWMKYYVENNTTHNQKLVQEEAAHSQV